MQDQLALALFFTTYSYLRRRISRFLQLTQGISPLCLFPNNYIRLGQENFAFLYRS